MEEFKIGEIENIFYIPNFINKEEEEELIKNVFLIF
jgi:hypothetical protein